MPVEDLQKHLSLPIILLILLQKILNSNTKKIKGSGLNILKVTWIGSFEIVACGVGSITSSSLRDKTSNRLKVIKSVFLFVG